jgi:hypothetical protein
MGLLQGEGTSTGAREPNAARTVMCTQTNVDYDYHVQAKLPLSLHYASRH